MGLTYDEADLYLGSKDDRPWANNTRLQRHGKNAIAMHLHNTDVVTFYRGDVVILNSGGWLTVTTKERMNRAEGIRVFSDRGRWYVALLNSGTWPEVSDEGVVPFFDGMQIDLVSRTVVGELPDVEREDRANEATKLKIKKYVALYTDERIANLVASAQAHGTGGDCWFCCLYTVGTHEPLGEVIQDNDHLFQHLKDGYTMASLALNAVTAAGYKIPALILDGHPDLVRRAIGRYLRKRLLVGVAVA